MSSTESPKRSGIKASILPSLILFIVILAFGTGLGAKKKNTWDLTLSDDNEVLQAKLLHHLPLGTQLRVVSDWFANHKYNFKVSKTGFLKQSGSVEIVGVRSIRVELGQKRRMLFFTETIEAFCGFNQKDQLIDIWIWKTTDAL